MKQCQAGSNTVKHEFNKIECFHEVLTLINIRAASSKPTFHIIIHALLAHPLILHRLIVHPNASGWIS